MGSGKANGTSGSPSSSDDLPPSVHIFVKKAFQRAASESFDPSQIKQLKKEIRHIITKGRELGFLNYNKWTMQHIPILDGANLPLDLYSKLTREQRDLVDKSLNNSQSGASKRPANVDSDSESLDDVRVSKKSKSSGSTDSLGSRNKLAERSKRFERELKSSTKDVRYEMEPLDMKPIVGTNLQLEKKYLRLTSQPKPEAVRPLKVLKKTLKLLLQKYFEGASYNYLCDQCKSMRQDLTVQNIKNEFTVEVYQFHSKIAMEFQDIGEFNQCQSQLKILYENESLRPSNWLEFVGYRLLYYIYTGNRVETDQLIIQLIDEGNDKDSFIKTSIVIDKLLLKMDYFNLKQLLDTLKLVKEPRDKFQKPMFYFYEFLLNQIIVKERVNVLISICKSYRQLDLDFMKNLMSFDSKEGLEQYLNACGLEQFIQNGNLMCHLARPTVERLGHSNKRVDIKGQL